MGGLDWDSPAVKSFRAALPAHQRLVPLSELTDAARANLRQCFIDAGQTYAGIDDPTSANVSLDDMKLIVSELDYLPPLCPAAHVGALRDQLLHVAPRRGFGSLAEDASGGVMSPSPQAVRSILSDNSVELSVARQALQLLTAITRQPEGSAAPGEPDGPPARVTLRDLKAGTPSTLGEPKHVDGRMQPTLPPSRETGIKLVQRPRLIWSKLPDSNFDTAKRERTLPLGAQCERQIVQYTSPVHPDRDSLRRRQPAAHLLMARTCMYRNRSDVCGWWHRGVGEAAV